MARIWVLTQPTGGNIGQEIIRADVITSVSGGKDNVLAVRSDTKAVVSLAWGSSAGKPNALLLERGVNLEAGWQAWRLRMVPGRHTAEVMGVGVGARGVSG
ncbi:hypothetical protein [Streptomyces sp. NPDC057729]|uniref:hypothetical protein n=1 Tax=Streptomyces sp. NPDC057729 TaxID=3346230 RepID=UPI0036796347